MTDRAGVRGQPDKRWTMAVAVAVTLAACAVTPLAARDLLDRVIAVVSGTVITLSDAKAAIRFELVETKGEKDPIAAAMQWLVDRQLVLDEANRYEFGDPTAEQFEAMYGEVTKRLSAGGATPAAALASLGFNDEGAKRFVRDTLRVQQFLQRRFESVQPGTEDELRTFYAANAAKFTKDGKALSFEDARPAVEQTFEAIRRVQTIDAYLARLHRRADVNELYVAVR